MRLAPDFGIALYNAISPQAAAIKHLIARRTMRVLGLAMP
jgi:hypothetical protein